MIVEVGKAYKIQDGRDCFCYLRDKNTFYFVVQPRMSQRYDTFTVDEQGVVIHNQDKATFGERILPFIPDSLEF